MWGNQVKVVAIAAVGIMAATLSSCSLSRDEFELLHTTLEGSPKIRADIVKQCEDKTYSKSTIHELSALMNVPEAKTQAVYCRRLNDAIADGRINYADYQSLSNVPSARFIKVMQGR